MHRFKERAVSVYPGGQLDTDEKACDPLAFKYAGRHPQPPPWLGLFDPEPLPPLPRGWLHSSSEAVGFPLQRFNGKLTAMTCIVRGWDRPKIEASVTTFAPRLVAALRPSSDADHAPPRRRVGQSRS